MTRASRSKQRKHYPEAIRLRTKSAKLLQPLHDTFAEHFPSFDGIVYFALDTWHKNNASAVVTVQPQSEDADRFSFYKQNIAYHRVDLGATALGEGLLLREPALLSSRMNPDRHVTIVHRVIIDGRVVGGLQTAFSALHGDIPASTEKINEIWAQHEPTVREVAQAFHTFSEKVRSIGDVLELNPPATPNTVVISWDLHRSTALSEVSYGALRNYLIETKLNFGEAAKRYRPHIHDTGDGQDIAIWLPEITEGFDRADKTVVHHFGKNNILSLIDTFLALHEEIAADYPDLAPKIIITVGLGYLEHDVADARTSAEFWQAAKIMKSGPSETVSFTPNAQRIFFPK